MNIFFTSDHHFHHANILKFHPERPFKDVNHMNEGLIERWNSVVGENDTIYHLGDFSFAGPQGWDIILRRLNGRKHLILGNHDKKVAQNAHHFVSINQYQEITIDGRKICLFHYPILSWNKAHRESWQLHGHCHYNLPIDLRFKRMDVGIDNPLCKWTPFSYDQVAKFMAQTLPFKPIDHHGL